MKRAAPQAAGAAGQAGIPNVDQRCKRPMVIKGTPDWGGGCPHSDSHRTGRTATWSRRYAETSSRQPKHPH
jgi:hypothetical protein